MEVTMAWRADQRGTHLNTVSLFSSGDLSGAFGKLDEVFYGS